MYNALIDAFAIPGQQNMSALTDMITQIKAKSTVTKSRVISTCSVQLTCDRSPGSHPARQLPGGSGCPPLGQHLCRPQSMWNAMVFSFMSDGIPIVYYGQEQGFHGNADPVS